MISRRGVLASSAAILAPYVSALAMQPLRIVGTRGSMPRSTFTAGSGSTRIETRVRSTLAASPIKRLWIAYGHPLGAPNHLQVEAAMEIDGVGVAPALPFTDSVVGAFDALVLFGPVAPADFGLQPEDLAGRSVIIRTGTTLEVGQKWRGGDFLLLPGEQTRLSDKDATSSEVLATGPLTNGSAVDERVTQGVQPLAIIGDTEDFEHAFILLGDSNGLANGANWASRDLGDGGMGGGYMRRALYDVNGRAIPWASQCINGVTAQTMRNAFGLRALWRFATGAVIHLGYNDGLGGPINGNWRTWQQTAADLSAIRADMRTAGIQHIVQAWAPPFTTSSDDYETLTGQTPISTFETNGAFRDPLNASFVQGTDNIDHVLPLASWQGTSSHHSDKWAVAAANEGGHPEISAHIAEGDALAAHVAALGGASVSSPAWVAPGADLDLDLVNSRKFGCARFPDVLASSRANAISYARNAFGTLIRFPAGALRRTDLGVLEEAAATNEARQSQKFTQSPWALEYATLAASGVPSPDGDLTATKLIASNVAWFHRVTQQTAATIGQTYCWSAFVKPQEYDRITLESHINFAHFLLTGSGSVLAGIGGVERYGDGWYRVWIPRTVPVSNPVNMIYLNNGSANFQGDGVSGSLIWGAQFEPGSVPSSYIKTGAAAVVRAADGLTLHGTPLASLGANVTIQRSGSFITRITRT